MEDDAPEINPAMKKYSMAISNPQANAMILFLPLSLRKSTVVLLADLPLPVGLCNSLFLSGNTPKPDFNAY